MDIGVDLGTANTVVYLKNKGIVLREPSIVAISREKNKIMAVGEEAKEMIGRAPGSIILVQPLRDGVIADFNVTSGLIRHVIEKVSGNSITFRPRIMICVPSGVTQVEKRAVQEAAEQAGAREVWIIEEPLAAAIGAGLNVNEPQGTMVVDIGGGTTDVAVISLGSIAKKKSIKVGGYRFDSDITAFIRQEYNLMIGERTTEILKEKVGAAFVGARDAKLEVRGRDIVTGLPSSVEVTSDQVARAIDKSVANVIDAIKDVLASTNPELSADIIDKGIVLTGGGALLYGLDKLITKETGLSAFVAEDALDSVAKGCGRVLESGHYS